MIIHLFGDQTVDQIALLRKICSRKNNVLLSSFLEQVVVAIRNEIEQLSPDQKLGIPNFLSIRDLAEACHRTTSKNLPLECATLTLTQLAHYIGDYDGKPAKSAQRGTVLAIGSCTGMLAASTVASAASAAECVPVAVEAVRIAFRVGVQVASTRAVLAEPAEHLESWSTIVGGLSEVEVASAIDEFHVKHDTPTASRVYISAVSGPSLTVSGRPPIVRKFLETSPRLHKSHRLPLAIFGPFHAKHLYQNSNTANIIPNKSREVLQSISTSNRLYSAATGQPIEAKNSLQLFETSIREILEEPVRWDRVLSAIVSHLSIEQRPQVAVTTFGSANISHSLATALKNAGATDITLKGCDAWDVYQDQQSFGRTQNDKIAIVGMAGRFPSAKDHEALWELLENGLDVHREVPPDRFDAQAHCDPSGKGKNKSHTPYGCFIDEPGLFDPRFFNMSPREAAQTDPMGRLALVTAYEALEMSGFVANRTPSSKQHRVGTFYGQTSDDWREINAAEDVDTYFITGGVRAFAPGRINYYFKFSGPSYSIDTACSSSLAAIQIACTSLWAGECDTACAGGLNVLTNPDIFAGLSKGQFLSKTGSCKTYDDGADGYCRGDGCGTIILKRYEDAIADRDNILGCILGAATNHSAEAISITHPHAETQEVLYSKVLQDCGVDPHEINYVEMHGTGTQAGDAIEMESVSNVFAPRHRQRRPDQPLYLGAVKANIGHGEAASGINSIIKVLQMFQKDAIPPNVGIKDKLNTNFPDDLGRRGVHIQRQTVPYPRKVNERRKVFLNNFSAAGGNTALVLEDGAHQEVDSSADPRPVHVVTVTSRSISSMKANILRLVAYLDANPKTSLPSLAYTTTARRNHYSYRVAVTISESSEIAPELRKQIQDSYKPIPKEPNKVAFAFTGQGSQYVGIGKEIYEHLPSFREHVDRLDSLVCQQNFPSFLPLITGSSDTTLSPVAIQLGLVCIQVAIARMWRNWGVEPSIVVGHSLGEYAALQVAGVISASDMIHLVGHRARLLTTKCKESTYGMLAVKASEASIRALVNGDEIDIACVNSATETVLSGTVDQISRFNDTLSSNGIKATRLNVPFAFHSSQIDVICKGIRDIAAGVTFRKPIVPLLSPLLGSIVQGEGTICAEYLVRHARETVNFHQALTTGRDENLLTESTVWLEVGPHPTCLGFVKAIFGPESIRVPSLRRERGAWETLSTSICTLYTNGIPLSFQEFHRPFNAGHGLLRLPSYAFDDKRYWLDYHNNWCLSKGESPAPPSTDAGSIVCQQTPTLSTSCQKIIEQQLQQDCGSVVIRSDLSEPKLHGVVIGHVVNDAPLCPSSLYADMALTVANYLYKKLRPDSPQIGLNVCSLEVHKPLIVKESTPEASQHLQLEASADLKSGTVQLKFRSVTPGGDLLQEHGHGLVKYEDVECWKTDWHRTQFMVQTQIDLLRQKVADGRSHKVLRGMAYKLFSTFVTYADKYQGMADVMLDSEQTEASARICFRSSDKDGDFFCAPYWIDSMFHVSGFIINAADTADSVNNAFISHGWSAMKLSRPLSADKEYRSYVRMQPGAGNIMVGDVYIFEDDEIIAVCEGLKFQSIPRRVLNVMLPPSIKSKSVANAIVTKQPQAAAKPSQSARQEGRFPVPAQTVSAADPSPVASGTAGSSVVGQLMQIIAEETDVDMSELVNDALFENLGVDSLMSLTISARLREELDLDINSTLFTDCPTVGSMKAHFSQTHDSRPLVEPHGSSSSEDNGDGSSTDPDENDTPSSSVPSSSSSQCGKLADSHSSKPVPAAHLASQILGSSRVAEQPSAPLPPASSVLLQGSPKTATKKLFLFPDGSGSATSYVSIPRISPDLAVFGLNCPFMKRPLDFVCGIEGIASLYLDEVRRRQPEGPYLVGGWSAGGVIAYEVTRQLIALGQKVDALLLLDAPCPVRLEALPARLHHFFDSIGLLGTGKVGETPEWLLPHFNQSIKALSAYQPEPLEAAVTPRTVAIWATDGVCGDPSDPRPPPGEDGDPAPMKWLLNNRTDFGDNGWGELLGSERMEFSTIKANHFTMMRSEKGEALRSLIRDGLRLTG